MNPLPSSGHRGMEFIMEKIPAGEINERLAGIPCAPGDDGATFTWGGKENEGITCCTASNVPSRSFS